MNTERKGVLAFGELLWDVFPDGAHIGGAPFNLAAHAVRCGLTAQLLSRVGADDLGRRALAETRRLVVGTDAVSVDLVHPTGTVTITLDAAGQPTYTIHAPAAWDFIAADADTLALLRRQRVDAICCGTLAQRSAASRASLQHLLTAFPTTPVFFDVNLRQKFFSRELVEEGLARTTILKLNDAEVTVLAPLIFGAALGEEAFAREVQRRFPVQLVLVTRGARGCLLVERGGAATDIPGRAVTVADAVGAGDAFSAAFLAFWLRGRSPVEAAIVANELGAFVASRRGAVPEYTDAIRQQLA
jgi:fructokinase